MSFQLLVKQQVSYIREQCELFLTDTCNIRRKIGESIVNGESIPIYTGPVTTKCRFIVRSGSEDVNIASQERATQQSFFTGLYRLQLPYGTEINQGDMIEFNDIALDSQRVFNVVFVPPHHGMTGAFIIFLQEET